MRPTLVLALLLVVALPLTWWAHHRSSVRGGRPVVAAQTSAGVEPVAEGASDQGDLPKASGVETGATFSHLTDLGAEQGSGAGLGESPEEQQIRRLEGQVEYLQGQVEYLRDENEALLRKLGTLGMKQRLDGSPMPGEEPADMVGLGIELTQLRELQALPLPPVAVPMERLEAAILKDLRRLQPGDEAQRGMRALHALGWVPEGMDPLPLEAALYARQLGVWYEEETASLLVLEPEAAAELPGALEREVLGTAWGQLQREFQNRLFVALRGAGEEGAATMTTDERLARWALLAGDAGLTRFLYVLQNPQPMDPNELPSTDPDHPYNAIPLPQLMRDLHFFPFNEGFELVQSLHSLGGFLQVDAAYSRPPESCRAVLDTEVYLNAHSLPPVRIELPLPSGGERPHTDDRLGPYVIRMALLKANEAEKAGMASVGWIGDRLLAFPAEVGEAGRSDAVWQTRWLEPDFAQAFFRAAGELIQHTYQAKAEIREGELKLKAAGRRVTLKIHEGGRAVTWLDTDAGAARSQALHEHYIGVTSETP